ncbi:MAG: hypothetical protein ABUL60_20990 [Myxococcales bacterium]
MAKGAGFVLGAAALVLALPAHAVGAGLAPRVGEANVPSDEVSVVPVELLPSSVSKAVADELARRRLLLAMHDLRLDFRRDQSGTWFLRIANTRTGCEASEPVGSFDSLSRPRIEALAFSASSLVERSHCGVLTPEPSAEPEADAPRAKARLAPWVRSVGGVWAGSSALALTAVWLTDDPKLPASFAHAPSATLFSGLGVGFAGGMSTIFVPERVARPMLEISMASSLALAALSFAQIPEPGVPAYGEYAVASGYAATAALIGVDAALSSPDAMLSAPAGASAQDAPRRALSPWLVYTPAALGALVSVSRAFDPDMAGSDRELALGFGLSALVPASAGLLLGVLDRQRSEEHEAPERWLASGPRGSLGLTLGGSF